MSRRSYRVSSLAEPEPAAEREPADVRMLREGAEYPPEVVGNPSVLKMALQSAADSPAVRSPQKGELSPRESAGSNSGKLALHLAVEFGNVDCVRELLQYKMHEVHAYDSAHETPCIIAARTGNSRILSLLLQASPDVKVTDSNGDTALHKAALGGFLECVQLLLKYGASVHDLNNVRQTALIGACQSDSPGGAECALILMNADSYVNIQDEYGYRALNYAARKCGKQCIQALLARGADMYNHTDPMGWSPVQTAVIYNNIGALQGFLETGLDTSKICATSKNFNQRPRTLLACACMAGHQQVAALLLKHGEDPNIDYPLEHAAVTFHSDLVTLLLQYGAIPDPAGRGNSCPLVEKVICSSHISTSVGSETQLIKVLKPLLRAGAQVNRTLTQNINTQSCNHSALTRAISLGYLPAVKMLLIAGAKETQGRLVWAQQLQNRGDLGMVPYLTEWMEETRSLQHLSRGVIRHCMGVHVTKKIDSLPFGKLLKRYLHLEELDDIRS